LNAAPVQFAEVVFLPVYIIIICHPEAVAVFNLNNVDVGPEKLETLLIILP